MPLPKKVRLFPGHMAVLALTAFTIGEGFTTIVAVAALVQLFTPIPATPMTVLLTANIVNVGPLVPSLHK